MLQLDFWKIFFSSNSATKRHHFSIAFITRKRENGGRFGCADNKWGICKRVLYFFNYYFMWRKGYQFANQLLTYCKICQSCFFNILRIMCKMWVNKNPASY